MTESVLLLVQQLLDYGNLPATVLSRFEVQLNFLEEELGLKLFTEQLESSPYLNLRCVAGVYFVALDTVHPAAAAAIGAEDGGDGEEGGEGSTRPLLFSCTPTMDDVTPSRAPTTTHSPL